MFSQEDPLYAHYQCLNCELMPVQVDSEEFIMVSIFYSVLEFENKSMIGCAFFFPLREEMEDKVWLFET